MTEHVEFNFGLLQCWEYAARTCDGDLTESLKRKRRIKTDGGETLDSLLPGPRGVITVNGKTERSLRMEEHTAALAAEAQKQPLKAIHQFGD